jgi:hypothetical protein
MTKPKELNLIRDVLDKLLVDCDRTPLGRVDGIIFESDGGGPPRVIEIASGAATLAQRLSTRAATATHRFCRRIGLSWRKSVQLEWSKIKQIGREITVDEAASKSPLLGRERWLRDHIIRHVPANGGKEKAK